MPTALVTGASSGIGRGIAADLLARGWSVTAVARDPARGQLAGALEIAADLSDPEQAVAAVAAHRAAAGRLDLLVNAAGVGITGPLDDYPLRRLDLQLDVNVRALFVVTRECLPELRAARGLIVNLASVAGLRGFPQMAAYGAAKHAVVGFTRALNAELGGDGVRATALCPELVDTPMTAWARGQVAPAEMIQVADVVAAVRMLLELGPTCLVPELAIERPGTGRDSLV
jgi:NAD(P)-dependent dehydrogenase (short-subunit alcohol dehydrogenase family)